MNFRKEILPSRKDATKSRTDSSSSSSVRATSTSASSCTIHRALELALLLVDLTQESLAFREQSSESGA